ncbi:TOBE domain-containing protein [uncultured Desulfovibrio sp.]|uniref:TOBE domain-containing protein n=1 Tax=uncultured Desulfovibrio sp. TaxID=167968 RepID=UPI0026119BBA|nr:TOBE domain-containing protein [uncultured Desulfovibrio sp.]
MSCLSREMLEALSLRWEAWEGEATTPGRRVTRARLHLAFLLVRYGGLRLGEVLGLDARRAVDTVTGMLHVPGPNARDVLLPMSCMRHVRRLLSLPEAAQPDFLVMDEGFLRKKFYAVAASLGIAPALAGPRALRHARGLELLSLHVPLGLVQKFLGQQKPSQVVAFLDFADGAARRMLREQARRRLPHLSGEEDNLFVGMVTGLAVGMRVAEVEVTTFADMRLVARCDLALLQRLELHENQVISVHVASEEIVLTTEPVSTSLGNMVRGTVSSLHADRVECFVGVDLPDGTVLRATLESAAVEGLHLYEGRRVYALFSSRAVRLCDE